MIGAFAAVVHGWPEPTSDIDITPDRSPDNLRRLAEALRAMDARALRPDGTIDEAWPIDDQHLRLQETTFLTTRHGDLDIVVNPAAAHGFADLARPTESIVVSLGAVRVRVATLERVIASKRAVGRAKDRDVLPGLEALLRQVREEA